MGYLRTDFLLFFVWYQVELSKLDQDKAHIQITYVEPYFDNYGKIKIKYIIEFKIINVEVFYLLNANTQAQKKKQSWVRLCWPLDHKI